jgi:hypothetical protein
MRISTKVGTIVCAALIAFVAGGCSSTKGKQAAAPIDEAELQAKWVEFATPSAGHEPLQQKIGKWKLAVSIFTAPGQPPMQWTGTSEVESILDGRYIADTTQGEAMGQPFHGRGIVGYDNLKKKYVSTWIDNMGTGVMVGEGTYDAARKTWSYTTQQPDLMTGTYVQGRAIEKCIDDDHWVLQSFGPDANGVEFLGMEIHYTRQ